MIVELAEFLSLLRRRRWSLERTAEERDRRLRALVAHAYEHVPYYRRLMDRCGVKPEQIQSVRDLPLLPVTTKDDLRAAGADCLDARRRDLFHVETSGSSGTPFRLWMTHGEYRRRRLREFRAMLGVGVKPRDRMVLLGPVRTRPRRLHRRLGLYRLEVIPYAGHPLEQAERLERAQPDVLWFYPTVLKQVLSHTGRKMSGLARPRLLISSAQMLDSPFRRRLQEDLPDARLTEFYGSAEVGRIAAGCGAHDGLHLEDDALIVELVEGGVPVADGDEGETCITALEQFAMPLIRYAQGDRCRLRLQRCPCGRSSPLIDSPTGRNADMITLPSGRKLSVIGLDVALRDLPGLIQYRFIQDRADRLMAQLCFETSPPPGLLEDVRISLRDSLPEPMEMGVGLFGAGEIRGPRFKVMVSLMEGGG